MCGILGQISLSTPIEKAIFDAKRDTLQHRGPDDANSWFSENQCIALGHRRLALVDLSASGQQPMCNEDGTLWLTFNGEIYNYIELKNTLQKAGHIFKSNTDSEVLLHGYEEWGIQLLARLKGMFAFGIWDDREKQLFLARDRFGIKPLYYGWLGDQFYFASELKAILHILPQKPSLNKNAICDYLAYRYVPSPKTIWHGLHKLPPAHYLLLDVNKNVKLEKPLSYWQLSTERIKVADNEAVETIDFLLSQSIREHLRSDIQIGSFLSGGYDSSALVYYMNRQHYPVKTFSIGFENWEQSEHFYARTVADHLGIKNHACIVGEEQLNLVDKLMYHYDEPIADISIIPTYVVSQLARQHTKAVFSGEGADEIFGGYTWQKDIAPYTKKSAYKAFIKHFFTKGNNNFVERYAHAMAMGRFTNKNLAEYLHPDYHEFISNNSEWFYAQHYQPFQHPLKSFQYLDIKTFMGELVLTKIDRASMAHSLEVRVPFLDHELVEYLYNLHEVVYYKPEFTKYLLFQNIKNALPPAILQRKKQGFVGPDRYYMNINWYANQLINGKIIQENIIKNAGLHQLIKEKDHWRLWKLLILEKWLQVWH